VAQRRLHLAVFLRDFHVDKTGPVDIAMLDFLADVMASTNQGHATVLSAYRTRETNERLEATTFGVAEHSQHVVGRASTLPSTVILAGGARRRSARHQIKCSTTLVISNKEVLYHVELRT